MKNLAQKYDWILFDADETLFKFDAFSGLRQMFLNFKTNFTEQDYQEYQAINKPLWTDYQNHKISAKELQCKRFDAWSGRLNIPADTLNSAFLAAMADICVPLDGAESLLEILHGYVKLGIITNGFTELQQIRLERTGFKAYFEFIVISEMVGIAKPHPKIFEYALSLMGNPQRNRVLMIGDNLDSDILGGLNAGFDTCWLNVEKKPAPPHVTPHYEVTSHAGLKQWFLRNFL